MPYAKIDGRDLFYTVSRGPGESPTLVLVHGAGGSRLHWPSELRRLSGATVYTLDLPGHGRSEGPGFDAIDGYAGVVASFLRATGIDRPVVLGHSMGGAIAQTLVLDAASVLSGIVLVATGARLRVAPAILEGIHSDFEEAVELITRLAWSSEAPARLVDLGRQALLETGPEVLGGDFLACDRFDVMGWLGEIDAPVLVIAGTADRLTPIKYGRFLAHHIPDAQCVTVERAGHMVMLEHPTEVMQAVHQFISELP